MYIYIIIIIISCKRSSSFESQPACYQPLTIASRTSAPRQSHQFSITSFITHSDKATSSQSQVSTRTRITSIGSQLALLPKRASGAPSKPMRSTGQSPYLLATWASHGRSEAAQLAKQRASTARRLSLFQHSLQHRTANHPIHIGPPEARGHCWQQASSSSTIGSCHSPVVLCQFSYLEKFVPPELAGDWPRRQEKSRARRARGAPSS